MKNLKTKLFKVRLMSAVLASIELANIGITSHAIKPSDAQASTETSDTETSSAASDAQASTATSESQTEARVKTAEKMEEMSPEKLLDYLKRVSTVEELERYYDNGTLDKSRQDVENFKLIEKETKNNFFEYIIKLISEGNLKVATFKKLPMEIRTEFWEFAIYNTQISDLKKILTNLGVEDWVLHNENIKIFVSNLSHIAKPQTAAKMFGKYHAGKDYVMYAITFFYDDTEVLNKSIAIKMSQTPDGGNFDYENKEAFNCTSIEYAAIIGNEKAFKYLLLNGAQITRDTKQFALWGENEEIIHLTEQNDPNFPLDQTTAMGLVSTNRDDLIAWLDMHFEGIDGNITSACCEEGNLSILVKIIKDCPDMLLDKMFLNKIFLTAARYDNIEIIKFLLKKGANVNVADAHGRTALIHAIYGKSSQETIDFLIKNGANVDTMDNYGFTTWVHAFRGAAPKEMFEVLIENRLSVNETDDGGWTPLMMAISYEMPKEVIELLIKNGANVNAVNHRGATALSIAIERGLEEIAQLLIANGAKQ